MASTITRIELRSKLDRHDQLTLAEFLMEKSLMTRRVHPGGGGTDKAGLSHSLDASKPDSPKDQSTREHSRRQQEQSHERSRGHEGDRADVPPQSPGVPGKPADGEGSGQEKHQSETEYQSTF